LHHSAGCNFTTPGQAEVSAKGWRYPLTPLLQLSPNPSKDVVKKILEPLGGRKNWIPATLRSLAAEKRSDVLFSVLEVSLTDYHGHFLFGFNG